MKRRAPWTGIDASDAGPSTAEILAQIPTGPPALHVAFSAETQEPMGRLSQQLRSEAATMDEALSRFAESDQAG